MVSDIPEVIELDVYPSWAAQDMNAFAPDVNLDFTFDEDWLEHVLDSTTWGRRFAGKDHENRP